jgi:hypothetical protein
MAPVLVPVVMVIVTTAAAFSSSPHSTVALAPLIRREQMQICQLKAKSSNLF